jgi:hypothetical protein
VACALRRGHCGLRYYRFIANIGVFILMIILMLRAAIATQRTVSRLRLVYMADSTEVIQA